MPQFLLPDTEKDMKDFEVPAADGANGAQDGGTSTISNKQNGGFKNKIKALFTPADDGPPVKEEDKIPFKEKLLYGAADLFGGGHNTILSVILLFYMTTVANINIGIAGTIVLVSKIWDAIIDPSLGVISDNSRSRFGRRKPFMFLGGMLIIPAYAFLFAPIQNFGSEAERVVFIVFAYLFYCTTASLSQVPFMSMASDISPDHRERNSANTVKLIFDMVSAGLCYLVPAMLMESLKSGSISQMTFYLIIVLGFGIVFTVPMVLAAIKVKERTPVPAEKAEFHIKEWLASFKIKSYKYHIIMYVAAFLCLDIISALAIFYVDGVLNGVMLFGKQISSLFIIAPMMVLSALIIPICYVMMLKKSKQFAYRMGLPLYALGAVLLAVFQTSWPSWLVPIFACLMGFGLGGAQMMPWLIYPDTVDVAELKLGERPAASFSGVMTFARTFSSAIAIQLVSLVLALAGYKESTLESAALVVQPDSALIAIRIVLGVSSVILLAVAFWASMKYKVTDKKLARVRYFNEHQRQGTLSTLRPAELKERESLIAELADDSLKTNKINLNKEYIDSTM